MKEDDLISQRQHRPQRKGGSSPCLCGAAVEDSLLLHGERQETGGKTW